MLTTISAASAVSSALSPPAFAAFWTDLFNRRIVDAIERLLSSVCRAWKLAKYPITDRWKEAQLFNILLSQTASAAACGWRKLQYSWGMNRLWSPYSPRRVCGYSPITKSQKGMSMKTIVHLVLGAIVGSADRKSVV